MLPDLISESLTKSLNFLRGAAPLHPAHFASYLLECTLYRVVRQPTPAGRATGPASTLTGGPGAKPCNRPFVLRGATAPDPAFHFSQYQLFLVHLLGARLLYHRLSPCVMTLAMRFYWRK